MCSWESPLFLSYPYLYNFASLWNGVCYDYKLFMSLFMSQNHRWPSHLKFGKPLKNHCCQWSICKKTFNGDGQGVAKPLKNHRWQWCPEKKSITIASFEKNYHRWSLPCNLLTRDWVINSTALASFGNTWQLILTTDHLIFSKVHTFHEALGKSSSHHVIIMSCDEEEKKMIGPWQYLEYTWWR